MSLKGRIEVMAGILAFFAAAGCEIRNCEHVANCEDPGSEKRGGRDEHVQCVAYCGRINVCGGPRADDFDGCVSACEERFRALPEETAALCSCATYSMCSDVNEGRCSAAPPDPSGGAGGVSSGSGGDSSSAGGITSAGGGYSTGGTPSTGGTSSGTGAAGTVVDAGAGTPCAHDCDCPAYETCISGVCAR